MTQVLDKSSSLHEETASVLRGSFACKTPNGFKGFETIVDFSQRGM